MECEATREREGEYNNLSIGDRLNSDVQNLGVGHNDHTDLNVSPESDTLLQFLT